jgi:hypothetical protein
MGGTLKLPTREDFIKPIDNLWLPTNKKIILDPTHKHQTKITNIVP